MILFTFVVLVMCLGMFDFVCDLDLVLCCIVLCDCLLLELMCCCDCVVYLWLGFDLFGLCLAFCLIAF